MNIQDLTLEQISVAILFIGGLYGGVKYLKKEIKDYFDKLFDSKLSPVNKKLDEMKDSINELDILTTKNFLVRFLSDVEREDYIYEQEIERFWEEFDHYTDDLGENSYIKEWVKDLQDAGKLKRTKPKPEKKEE